ncbi:hypothetical protein AB833_22790 [Chromatiales bacterium (ex Bugula neritina AB1)]|nr:hypothetical protein AB833_22790 [Chromatiales bacterium (ex Bugula neritina AB1)]
MSNDSKHSLLLADIRQLVATFRTVLMATATSDGDPEISYSPYAIHEGLLYVFVSDLSLHTGNLKDNPRASLLFIENESDCDNLHARRRSTFRCTATLIPREDPSWELVLDCMTGRFGEIMPVLKSLPDFHLFAMKPDTVVFVKGFADAHTLEFNSF